MPKKPLSIVLLICLAVTSPSWAKDDDPKLLPLQTLEDKVESLVERVLPVTVCVRAANGRGSGSGVIINEEGLVLTAAHVTQAAGKNVVIIFPNGRQVKGESLGANRNRDAGLVQILGDEKFAFAEMGDSADLKSNQWCVSLGHAGGFDPRRSPPVRLGRILSNAKFVTSDCTLIGGDSGGPLFDLDGKVIGIHSNIGASLSQNNHVPVNVFKEDMERMLKGETWGSLRGNPRPNNNGNSSRPYLGIQLAEESDDGVTISAVFPGTPADEAGLQRGDIVKKIGDTEIDSARALIELIGKRKPGNTVKMSILRDEKTVSIDVKLGRRGGAAPTPPNSAQKKDDKGDKDDEVAKNDKDKKDDKDGENKKDDDLDIEELLRRARQNGGRLQLTPEMMRRLREEMRKRGGQIPGLTVPRNTAEDQAWIRKVFASYEPVVDSARKSVFPVVVDKKQVALATAVDEGILITKASEIDGKEFKVRVGKNKLVDAKLVDSFEGYDLALIEVADYEVAPIKLIDDEEMQLGSFVAAVGTRTQPEAIGVVSVMPRSLDGRQQGFLGVGLAPAGKEGVRLSSIRVGSPADKGGLKKDDLVVAIDGKKHNSPGSFAKAISDYKPGDEVTLQVRRGDAELSVKVKLADRGATAMMPSRLRQMNQMGGQLSKKRTGFKMVLQHDCPLDPNDCGGPLVDLDGDVIGINIARAGRIKSHAIPADKILELLKTRKQ